MNFKVGDKIRQTEPHCYPTVVAYKELVVTYIHIENEEELHAVLADGDGFTWIFYEGEVEHV